MSIWNDRIWIKIDSMTTLPKTQKLHKIIMIIFFFKSVYFYPNKLKNSTKFIKYKIKAFGPKPMLRKLRPNIKLNWARAHYLRIYTNHYTRPTLPSKNLERSYRGFKRFVLDSDWRFELSEQQQWWRWQPRSRAPLSQLSLYPWPSYHTSSATIYLKLHRRRRPICSSQKRSWGTDSLTPLATLLWSELTASPMPLVAK